MKPGWNYRTAEELLEDVTRNRALLVEVLTYVQNEEANGRNDNAGFIYRYPADVLGAMVAYQSRNQGETVLLFGATVPAKMRRC